MTIEDAIYQLLKNDAGVTAFVSGKIFCNHIDQGVSYPAIMYKPDGAMQYVDTLEGGVTLARQRILVFSGAYKAATAIAIDNAVIKKLFEFSGNVLMPGTSPEESIDIQGIFLGPMAHDLEYDDLAKVHEALTVFIVDYLDPARF